MKMFKSRWHLIPTPILILSLLALGSSLAIYITSYVKVSNAFSRFVVKHNVDPSQILNTSAWVNILILSILIALIISGMALIYVYYHKVIQLYKMQQNFINGFTHELKTPVTSLKLFIDTFSSHELSREDQLKYLEYMKRDIDRLSSSTTQILKLAMIEEKEYRLDFTEILFPDYIQMLLKKNSHIFSEVDISVVGEQLLSIRGDESLIEMLIMNLLNNAITHNESDQVKIVINVKDQGPRLLLSIQDNGLGILKQHKKIVFKKFFRVKRAVKGSGIGLYMAHLITKLHDGAISVESLGEGTGSTFHLSFPRENYVN